MISLRTLFLEHLAPTSNAPLMLEPVRAEGSYIYDNQGKKYLDLISGIAVSQLGHGHPRVLAALEQQARDYLHLMVYGEFVQSPQVQLAGRLTQLLPDTLNSVFFVNSGSEAIEGALKLARRCTGRPKLVAFHKAYHGSTYGALSLMGNADYTAAFRPLIPGVQHLHFGHFDELSHIDHSTAAVVIEPVQGEAGVIVPPVGFLEALRARCTETGTLLVFDESQTGLGRTGMLFAFEHWQVIPDILVLSKALGGGLPLGAFIASKELMQLFTDKPVLGHITTFGGHPLCCATSLAALNCLIEEGHIEQVEQKACLFLSHLNHSAIKAIRSKGLFMAVELESNEQVHRFIRVALAKGIITDFFLFNDHCFRIAPPLNISDEQICEACKIIAESLDEIYL